MAKLSKFADVMQGHIDRLLDERFEERRETRGQEAQAWQTLLSQAAGGGLEGAQLSAQLAGTEEAPQAIRNVAQTRIPDYNTLWTQIQGAYGPGRDYYDIPEDPQQDIKQIGDIFASMNLGPQFQRELAPSLPGQLGSWKDRAHDQAIMASAPQTITRPQYTELDAEGNPKPGSDMEMISYTVPSLLVMEANMAARKAGEKMPFQDSSGLIGFNEKLKERARLEAGLSPEMVEAKAKLERATTYARQTAVNRANWEDLVDHWDDQMAFQIESQVLAGVRGRDLEMMYTAQTDMTKVLPRFMQVGELWNEAAPQLRAWMLDLENDPERKMEIEQDLLAASLRAGMGAKILGPDGELMADVNNTMAAKGWIMMTAMRESPELLVELFEGMPAVRKYFEMATTFQPVLARYFDQRGNLTEVEQTNAAMLLPTMYDLLSPDQGSEKLGRLLGGALAVPELLAASRGYGEEDLRHKPLELLGVFNEITERNIQRVLARNQLGRPDEYSVFQRDNAGNVLLDDEGNELLARNPHQYLRNGEENPRYNTTVFAWYEALEDAMVGDEVESIAQLGVLGRTQGPPSQQPGYGGPPRPRRFWDQDAPAGGRWDPPPPGGPPTAVSLGGEGAQGFVSPPPETPDIYGPPRSARPRVKSPQDQMIIDQTPVAEQTPKTSAELIAADEEEEDDTIRHISPGRRLGGALASGYGRWREGVRGRLQETVAEEQEQYQAALDEYIATVEEVGGQSYSEETKRQLQTIFAQATERTGNVEMALRELLAQMGRSH
jgi:hypothetical protein